MSMNLFTSGFYASKQHIGISLTDTTTNVKLAQSRFMMLPIQQTSQHSKIHMVARISSSLQLQSIRNFYLECSPLVKNGDGTIYPLEDDKNITLLAYEVELS